ncbi:hypothetical protein J6590_007371 [Homalodisca vitripennis]|nr:hypothetical protein J6590_007371 [Homalodisca vitripennis]
MKDVGSTVSDMGSTEMYLSLRFRKLQWRSAGLKGISLVGGQPWKKREAEDSSHYVNPNQLTLNTTPSSTENLLEGRNMYRNKGKHLRLRRIFLFSWKQLNYCRLHQQCLGTAHPPPRSYGRSMDFRKQKDGKTLINAVKFGQRHRPRVHTYVSSTTSATLEPVYKSRKNARS